MKTFDEILRAAFEAGKDYANSQEYGTSGADLAPDFDEWRAGLSA